MCLSKNPYRFVFFPFFFCFTAGEEKEKNLLSLCLYPETNELIVDLLDQNTSLEQSASAVC